MAENLEWRQITNIGDYNHRCLQNSDYCLYYAVYESYVPDKQPMNCSYAHDTIQNFKIKPSDLASNPRRWQYKNAAVERISNDLRQLISTWRPDLHYVLIPAITSRCKEDPYYDNRLQQVCVSSTRDIAHIDCLDLFDLTKNLASSHSNRGSRDPKFILPHILVDRQHSFAIYDYVFIFDDIISTGAHFKACQQALANAYGISNIGGIFWARTESQTLPQ